MVGNEAKQKKELLQIYHDSALGGHSGMESILQRLNMVLFWKRMKKEVFEYVRECVKKS